MRTRFIVVLGSVMSGLGKGVTTSTILKILDLYGYDALPIKFDGYLNYDCGTMNPYRHGEVFVLDDKSEVDMDFGTYERFLNKNLTGESSITGGKLFSEIIDKERKGEFLGQDIQMIPHLSDMIIRKLETLGEKKKADVIVVEVGGTVGDIENNYFIESMRQLSLKHRTLFVDVTYVPELDVVGEQKTKPTQTAFRDIMARGIAPDFIVCRSDKPITDSAKKKIALYTNIDESRIIDSHDLDTVYEVPINFMKQKVDKEILKLLGLKIRKINKKKFGLFKSKVDSILLSSNSEIAVGIVGKYVDLKDSYVSVKEALLHAGVYADVKIKIKWIESETLEKGNVGDVLMNLDAIIVPGGFGKRGTEGMINAIKYAREHRLPFLGLCLGMQLMAIEYARNVCSIKNASSSEFDPKTKDKVIDLMPEQRGVKYSGGTMRLGAWDCKITGKDTIAYNAYKSRVISERHRHRYELNNKYRLVLKKHGLIISGVTTDGRLVEMIEWSKGFGVGTQAHPELKSRLERPSPLFVSLLEAAKGPL
jgi:CTP synthase